MGISECESDLRADYHHIAGSVGGDITRNEPSDRLLLLFRPLRFVVDTGTIVSSALAMDDIFKTFNVIVRYATLRDVRKYAWGVLNQDFDG